MRAIRSDVGLSRLTCRREAVPASAIGHIPGGIQGSHPKMGNKSCDGPASFSSKQPNLTTITRLASLVKLKENLLISLMGDLPVYTCTSKEHDHDSFCIATGIKTKPNQNKTENVNGHGSADSNGKKRLQPRRCTAWS